MRNVCTTLINIPAFVNILVLYLWYLCTASQKMHVCIVKLINFTFLLTTLKKKEKDLHNCYYLITRMYDGKQNVKLPCKQLSILKGYTNDFFYFKLIIKIKCAYI